MSEPKPVPAFDWAELDAARETALAQPEPRRGFTVTMYAEKYGVSRSRARSELDRLKKAGTITRIGLQNLLRVGSKGGVTVAIYDYAEDGQKKK